MSRADYRAAQRLAREQHTAQALIMAAMQVGDPQVQAILADTWPHLWDELARRAQAPAGVLPEDSLPDAALPPVAPTIPDQHRGRHRATPGDDAPQMPPWFAPARGE